MARLAIELPDRGENPVRPQISEIQSKQSSQASATNSTQKTSASLRVHERYERETPSLEKKVLSPCIGEYEAKNRKLVEENAELTATVSQLRKTVSEYKDDVQSLREENKRLQDENKKLRESMAVAPVPQPNDFDRRLAEITSAVTHGLSHTLSALQSMSNGEQVSNTRTAEISLDKSQDQKSALDTQEKESSTKERLAITAGPTAQVSEKMPLMVAKDLSPDPEVIEKPVSQLVTKTQTEEQKVSLSNHNTGENDIPVKVKEEKPSKIMPYKYTPGSFDSVVNSTKRTTREDFDDITFFIKPTIKKRPSTRVQEKSLNDQLRKALPIKEKGEKPLIKTESAKHTDRERTKMKVKRELSDENTNIVVKREPTKRRKALAPITKSSNNRSSSIISLDKKQKQNVFDFVDNSTLLEQTRDSLKKAS